MLSDDSLRAVVALAWGRSIGNSVVYRSGTATALWEAAMTQPIDETEEHPPMADHGVDPHGDAPAPLPPQDAPPNAAPRQYAGWDDEPTK